MSKQKGNGINALLPLRNKEEISPKPLPTSRRTKATVLVMLSHDYNHFEAHIELTGEDISLSEIDNARKNCQRLGNTKKQRPLPIIGS